MKKDSHTPLDDMPEPSPVQLQLIAKSYAMRQLYWPSYTWLIQTESLNRLEDRQPDLESRGINLEKFTKQKADLFNKLNASFYHLQKMRDNESVVIELGKEMAEEARQNTPNGIHGIIGTPYEPIEYEYEALLITLRSALDIFAIIMAEPTGLSSDNIMSLLNDGQQQRNPSALLQSTLTILTNDKNTKTINEFRNQNGIKSKRNYAVHQGSLPTGTINIQFARHATDIGVLKTRTMEVDGSIADFTQQQSLDDYAANLFYSVCDLIIEALEVLVGWQLPKGGKCSVYEERLSKRKS